MRWCDCVRDWAGGDGLVDARNTLDGDTKFSSTTTYTAVETTS